MSDESHLDPTFLVVRCEHCQAKLRIRSTLAGKVGTCPKCRQPLSIPEITDYCAEDPSPPEPDFGSGYRLATPLEHQPDDAAPLPLPKQLVAVPPEHGFLDQLGQVRQVAISKPPKWTFFSGVFEFPWYSEVWPRWIWLVIGGIAISVIPVLAMGVVSGSTGYTGVALAFFAMPQIWLSIWTGSHAACCGIQVFEDTAAGNDRVTSWPEPNWREWMVPFLHQGYVALMVLALVYGIGRAVGLTAVPMYWSIAVTELILFPFCLLSVLETNNLVYLVSPTVTRTIFSKSLFWLTFYLLTAVLAGVWGGLLYLASSVHVMFGMIVNGFLFGTLVLIYFRLLGRLAWTISHTRRKKRVGYASGLPVKGL